MTQLDPRQSVEFEPVVLGRRGRGRRGRLGFDPLAVGVVVVVLGLVVAVVKPWGYAEPGREAIVAAPTAVQTAAPVPSGRPLTNDRLIPATPVTTARTLSWDDVEAVVRPHDGWGVRAFIRAEGRTSTGTRTSYQERWVGAIQTSVSGPRAVLGSGGGSAVALGLTFPSGHAPLDVRIWSRTAGGTWRWLDARPIGRLPAQGGLIFTPPTSALQSGTWGPGEYRIDALVSDGTIQRIELDIPDRYDNVRPASREPQPATELVSSSQVDPATVAVGPFATIDRVGVPLDVGGGAPLDEAGAWLDTEVGSGRAPVDRVAVAYLPRATGLGVRLPDGAQVRAATLTRLAPIPFVNGPIRIGGGIIDHRTDDPWVVFAARRGEAWDPGAYRIDVTWADEAGVHDAAWQIELRPGPVAGTPPLLAIARAWARHAGVAGVVVGRAEPLEGGPRSSAIRRLTIGAGTDDGDSATCTGTVIDGGPEAFGLTYPATDPVRVISVRAAGLGPTSSDVPTVQAAEAVPGLTVIAPADGGTFVPGTYYLDVADGSGQRVVTLCVGQTGTVSG